MKPTKLTKLSDLFDVSYGHSLELNRLARCGPEGVPFISRRAGNNGVAAYVERIPGLDPAPAGEMTCALSANPLSTFVQDRPFYTAFHVARLQARLQLTLHQKLYYCSCIYHNRYRYSYGRQANRTLKDVLLPTPEEIPSWVGEATVEAELEATLDEIAALAGESSVSRSDHVGETQTPLGELFQVVYGHSLELNHLVRDEKGVNFVSRTSRNNGVSARVAALLYVAPAPAGLISVACGGSVLESFLQTEPFYCGRDMYWLAAKRSLSVEEKLFYCACIRSNRYRYNFGRQANKTLRQLAVPAPEAIPAWVHGALGQLALRYKAELGSRRVAL